MMRSALSLLIATAMLAHVPAVSGNAPDGLLDQMPFDRITLDAENDDAVLKVFPLDLADRSVPFVPRPSDTLTVRLLDHPEPAYELAGKAVVRVELYEQMLLAEATALVGAARFGEAYDYFAYLETNHPKLPGLAAAIEDYLYEEAKVAHIDGEYSTALARLREVHLRNPDRAGLKQALAVTGHKLAEQYVTADDFASAWQILDSVNQWAPNQPMVITSENAIKQRADALMVEARQAIDASNLRKASRAVRRAMHVWPAVPEAQELLDTIRREYPRVVVGVSLSSGSIPWNADPRFDRGASRGRRLVWRTLTEFVGPGAEGGTYISPFGDIGIDSTRRYLTLDLKSNIAGKERDDFLTAGELSRVLLEAAYPDSVTYRPDWARLVGNLAVDNAFRLSVELARPHVRPDALLQMFLTPSPAHVPVDTSTLLGVTRGPYSVVERDDRDTVYERVVNDSANRNGRTTQLVERHFRNGAEAIEALKQGECHILDQVSPWGVSLLSVDKNLVVDTYGVPRVHCLIPNLRRPLTSQRTFRRALLYGIHRRAILDQLSGESKARQAQVVSGPFPVGTGYDDPISYGYDVNITPRPYDPRLAGALVAVSLSQKRAGKQAKSREGEPIADDECRLVLAYPADEIAYSACRSIERQLKLVGVEIELRELAGPFPLEIPGDVDLLYTAIAVCEPLIDAKYILGSEGIGGTCSPYMRLALSQLEEAADWETVGLRLRRIHQIAHDEVAVLPLWQLPDYFAYRKELTGIGEQPASLYQNVEQWSLAAELSHSQRLSTRSISAERDGRPVMRNN